LGALGGVLLLSTIDRGLNLMHVSVFWVKVIQGLIILVAMFLDAQRVRLRELSLPVVSYTSEKKSESET